MPPPPTDQAFTNLTVSRNLTVRGRLATNNAIINNAIIENADIDNLTNDTVETASINNGLQFDNIQIQVQADNHRNFMISNTVAQLTAGTPFPTFAGGRTVTFNNSTASTTLEVYITEGYPDAKAPTLLTTLAPAGGSFVWPIPTTPGWNGNFSAFPMGSPVVLQGATLAEFGFNQLCSGCVPDERETFDISTVPPGIGTLCNDGPHGFPPNTQNCVFFSRQSKFSTQQSFGYNVGMRIIPPAGSLPSATVTCIETNGDSPGSIGYPNDTAFPKQQTIELTGNYTVDFLDPVVPIP